MTSSVTVACQAVVAATFAASAAGKLAGPSAFADFRGWLRASVGVPRHAAAAAATTVVVAETATAVAVAVPPLAPAGFAVAALLLAAFTGAVVSMIRRRVRTPCRCFGAGRHPPGAWQVARNLILLVAAAGGGVSALAGAGSPPPAAPALVLAAVVGVTVALLLINLEEVAGLARPAAPVGRRPGS